MESPDANSGTRWDDEPTTEILNVRSKEPSRADQLLLSHCPLVWGWEWVGSWEQQ